MGVFTLKPEEEELFDKLAGLAMQGIMANNDSMSGDTLKEVHEKIARVCFSLAEAMIKERRTRKKTSIPYYPPVTPKE